LRFPAAFIILYFFSELLIMAVSSNERRIQAVKRTLILLVCMLVLLVPGFALHAYTTITGANGYFTMPITSVRPKGTVSGGVGYIFEVNNLYAAVNVVILKDWEVSGAKEFPFDSNADLGYTPWIVGTKWKFYEKGSFRTAIGGQIEFLGDEAGVDGTPVSLYAAVSDNAGALGYVNAGLGYTLGIDAGYRINFFFGLRRHIVEGKLFVIGEFTNYGVRQGLATAWDESRGIFNLGLQFEAFKFATFNLAAYDLLDEFITVGLGGEVYFDLW
jgi:hypothetical protein